MSSSSRGKRFTFTKSSKALPIQHFASEFSNIIQSKKIYQSMVKDELRKLKILDACVMDPEIQPFKLHTDAIPTKNITIAEKQTKNSDKIIEETNIKEQRDNWLDKSVEKKIIKQLQQIYFKQQSNKIYLMLKASHNNTKLNKAAAYFNYHRLCKYYFYMLKEQIGYSTSNSYSQTKLSLFLKKNNLLGLRSIVNQLKLKHRCQAFRKTIQFRTKKKEICCIRYQMKGIKQMKVKIQKLTFFTLKINIVSFLSVNRINKQNTSNWQTLTKARKMCSFAQFLKRAASKVHRNFKHIDSISVMIASSHINHNISDNQISQLCIENNVEDINQIKLIAFATRSKIVQSMLETKRHNLRIAQFLKSMKNLYYIGQQMRQLTNLKLYKNAEIIIHKLRLNCLNNLQLRKLRGIVLSNKMRIFVTNCRSSIKFTHSVRNCLKSSKQWLINNKRIYETQSTAIAAHKNGTDQLQLVPVLYHPLSHQNSLKQESKFQHIKLQHCSRLFIGLLKDKLRTNKRLRMAEYAIAVLKKNRTLRLVWDILKNKQLIFQLNQQITEQLQTKQDEQELLMENKAAIFMTRINQVSVYSHLRSNKQQKSKFGQFKQTLINKIRREALKVMQQNMNQLTSIKKTEVKINSCQNMFLGLQFKSLYLRLKQNHQIISKYTKLQTEIDEKSEDKPKQKLHPIHNMIELVSKKKQVNQTSIFLKCLQANHKINRKSIEITCLYLKNAIRRSQQYCQDSKAANKISQKRYTLESFRNNKCISDCLSTMTSKINSIQSERLKKNTLLNFKAKLSFKRVIRNLFQHSINCKNKQDLQERVQNLHIKMNGKNINLFFQKLIQNKLTKSKLPKNAYKNQNNQNILLQNESIVQNIKNVNISSSNINHNVVEQDEQELSYEKYRESLIKQGNRQNQSKILALQKNDEQNISPIKSSTSQQILDHNRSIELDSSQKLEQSNINQQFLDQPINKSIEKHEISRNQSNLGDISMNSEGEHLEYLERRFRDNLLKRYFGQWKYYKYAKNEQKIHNQQILRKAFEGLKMMNRQKKLVRLYLRELDEQVHYYPQSQAQYQEFIELSKQF